MALECKCHLDENRHLDKHNQQLFLRETEQERGGFAAMLRPFQLPTGNSRSAGLLPDSEVIQRVKIAESPVKRAFRGVRPPSVPSDGLRDAPRASTDGLAAFYRTNFARAPARQSDGLTFGIPSPAFPRTDFARIRKADADSTISQPRYGRNQPPLNHDSTILRVESKNDSDSTILHP